MPERATGGRPSRHDVRSPATLPAPLMGLHPTAPHIWLGSAASYPNERWRPPHSVWRIAVVAREWGYRTPNPPPGSAAPLRSGDPIDLISVRRSRRVGIDEAVDAGRDDPRLEHRD